VILFVCEIQLGLEHVFWPGLFQNLYNIIYSRINGNILREEEGARKGEMQLRGRMCMERRFLGAFMYGMVGK